MSKNEEKRVLELEDGVQRDLEPISNEEEEEIKDILDSSDGIQYEKNFERRETKIRLWEEEENCYRMKGTAQGSIEGVDALKWWSRFSQSHIIYNSALYQVDAGNVGVLKKIELDYEERTGKEKGKMVLECFQPSRRYLGLIKY